MLYNTFCFAHCISLNSTILLMLHLTHAIEKHYKHCSENRRFYIIVSIKTTHSVARTFCMHKKELYDRYTSINGHEILLSIRMDEQQSTHTKKLIHIIRKLIIKTLNIL